jgi:hypothetical protein
MSDTFSINRQDRTEAGPGSPGSWIAASSFLAGVAILITDVDLNGFGCLLLLPPAAFGLRAAIRALRKHLAVGPEGNEMIGTMPPKRLPTVTAGMLSSGAE